MRGLEGRNVIVTGAASGIGRAIAGRLAEEGMTVGVFDINQSGAEKAAAEIAAGGKAKAYAVDITSYAAVQAGVAAFEADNGPTDALVNNAGWDKAEPFLQSGPEIWEKVIGINLYGPIHMCHAVLGGMAERKGGRVVSIASDAGRVGSSGEAVYSACKGGIIAMTKTMARELARSGITLNTVCPGPTDTPLLAEVNDKLRAALERAIPMKRLARPADYPGMVAFLLSDDAAYITGQTISVSGGLTMHG
jgi:2-hydroxycyclohexanecarboxyl-CoA dehydrogenase